MIWGMVYRAILMADSLAANPRKGGRPPNDMILMHTIILEVSDILDCPNDEILFRFFK